MPSAAQKDDQGYSDNRTITTTRIRMSLTEYGLVIKVSIPSCLQESEKLFQECAHCTSGIFFSKTQENGKTCVPQHDLQQKGYGKV
jgi:hypothetical protein